MYCHVNVKTGSRGTGQSAAAKYDYVSRAGKYEAACQDEVVHLESGSMPSFASSDARLYWAAADSHERSNGRLFRSLTAALPNSLDSASRLDLARSFAAHVTAGELPYTLVVHAGLSKVDGKPDNPHLHLVFSERVNDGLERGAEQWFRRAAPKQGDPASGGARKTERTKPRAWLEETRSAWAGEMNLAFERAGVEDRVTAESHATQLSRARAAGDTALHRAASKRFDAVVRFLADQGAILNTRDDQGRTPLACAVHHCHILSNTEGSFVEADFRALAGSGSNSTTALLRRLGATE